MATRQSALRQPQPSVGQLSTLYKHAHQNDTETMGDSDDKTNDKNVDPKYLTHGIRKRYIFAIFAFLEFVDLITDILFAIDRRHKYMGFAATAALVALYEYHLITMMMFRLNLADDPDFEHEDGKRPTEEEQKNTQMNIRLFSVGFLSIPICMPLLVTYDYDNGPWLYWFTFGLIYFFYLCGCMDKAGREYLEDELPEDEDWEDRIRTSKKVWIFGTPLINVFAYLATTDINAEVYHSLENKITFVGRFVEDIPQVVLAILVLREEGGNTFAWLSLVPSIITCIFVILMTILMGCKICGKAVLKFKEAFVKVVQ